LEVWYTTLTDPATGTGVWLHHELAVPKDGGPARALGWAAVFPPGGAPVFGRFGPYDWRPGPAFAAGNVEVTADRLTGSAGELAWELRRSGGGRTLYTFPRWAWERELLPAAQIVPAPAARFDGTVRFGERVLELAGAPGASARIYGHGNARRWGWLHADLGDGDVCEVVAAVSTRPGLDRLPPLPFVRLRVGGTEWPSGDPLLAALRMRADLRLPTWTVRGRIGDRRIRIEVTSGRRRRSRWTTPTRTAPPRCATTPSAPTPSSRCCTGPQAGGRSNGSGGWRAPPTPRWDCDDRHRAGVEHRRHGGRPVRCGRPGGTAAAVRPGRRVTRAFRAPARLGMRAGAGALDAMSRLPQLSIMAMALAVAEAAAHRVSRA
jgi:hypothetical protein